MLENMIFKRKSKPMKEGGMSYHEPDPNIVLDGISVSGEFIDWVIKNDWVYAPVWFGKDKNRKDIIRKRWSIEDSNMQETTKELYELYLEYLAS